MRSREALNSLVSGSFHGTSANSSATPGPTIEVEVVRHGNRRRTAPEATCTTATLSRTSMGCAGPSRVSSLPDVAFVDCSLVQLASHFKVWPDVVVRSDIGAHSHTCNELPHGARRRWL
uniref:Uncharacterized protein n=1 Tax=Prorocentrum micans TaxID=2945 RepID=A0A7S2TBG9_PROMC|mmetsp:Transcript_11802/g.9488  ORF Transcript_11802/g.9488 Transcript_11802/m.9488 type:complete len:119 (-) Transcript_11802:57-413(-)